MKRCRWFVVAMGWALFVTACASPSRDFSDASSADAAADLIDSALPPDLGHDTSSFDFSSVDTGQDVSPDSSEPLDTVQDVQKEDQSALDTAEDQLQPDQQIADSAGDKLSPDLNDVGSGDQLVDADSAADLVQDAQPDQSLEDSADMLAADDLQQDQTDQDLPVDLVEDQQDLSTSDSADQSTADQSDTADGSQQDSNDTQSAPDQQDADQAEVEQDSEDQSDGSGTCQLQGTGFDTPVFNGSDDLAKFPAGQILTPGAWLMDWERFALTWDDRYLYIAMVSSAFENEIKPVHIYLEAGTSLSTATGSTGKEYSGLTPELPFSATHLVAARRKDDGYSGIYGPGNSWGDLALAFTTGVDLFVAPDKHTISIRVPWTALGCPTRVRIVAHVVNAVTDEEWKDLVPSTHTPWSSPGNGFYEIDLTKDPDSSNWTLE